MNNFVGRNIGNYEIQNKLGQGYFASVYKAMHIPSGFTVVIKIIPKNAFSLDDHVSFINEIHLMRSLHHPFITEFLDFFQTTTFYFIVMEYLCNGNLYDYILKKGKLEEIYVTRIFIQLLSVLQYLHEMKNIAHRNLKPQKILLDENYDIRLTDFSFSHSCQEGKDQMKTKCGTILCMAPEIILNQPYSNKCDLWSAGIILYFIVSGPFPFQDEHFQNLLTRIIN
jgi:5'-AMP-activated protein kinase catalytic alpha subunit